MTAITDTYFDSTAREYDERTLRGLPRYQEMLAQIVATLPSSAVNILELGCGTGALHASWRSATRRLVSPRSTLRPR